VEQVDGCDAARPCECTVKKRKQQSIQRSGIGEAFRTRTFTNFVTDGKGDEITHAKSVAMEYVKKFRQIQDEAHNSIAFLGQVGSGKTHLSVAIANNLMSMGFSVRYMEYRKDIDSMKRNKLDDMYYEKYVNRFKKCDVLLIDDLYKGSKRNGEVMETEIAIIFDIINHRYMQKKPIVVSSEFDVDSLIAADEGVGSRIVEMCKGRVVQLSGTDKNHRI